MKADTEGMRQDKEHHKSQRFDRSTGYRFLIHDGPRQNVRQRKRRLLKWLTKVFGLSGARRRTRF